MSPLLWALTGLCALLGVVWLVNKLLSREDRTDSEWMDDQW